MDIVIDKLEKILDDENGFFVKIRNLEGIDEKKLNDVLLVLEEIKEFYANSDLVPKRLLLLVMDMEPILWGMVESYPDPIKQQIFLSIDKIRFSIQECFSN
jgi:hypothetical protein